MKFALRMKSLGEKIREWFVRAFSDRVSRMLAGTILLAVLAGLICWGFYNQTHNFDDYKIMETVQEDDIDGTRYEMLGGSIIKYSPDGVFCVDTMNNVIWSSAYSMQTPIADVSGSSMAIAEEHGTQVYVLNEDGIIGNFSTKLSILDVCVSDSGVVLLKQQDSDSIWLNMYDASGTELASIKTNMKESGYPLSMALSSDATQVIVSFTGVKDGKLNGRIAMYDFSSSAESSDQHLTGALDYARQVFPCVYFGTDDVPIAISDSGMIIFKRGRTVEERARVDFDREIVSVFHDGDSCGFIFRSISSDDTDDKYHMEVYSSSGNKAMEVNFDFDYTGARMDSGEILVYDARNLYAYRTSGRQKISASYDKEVVYFAKISGFRRYLVITSDSMDQIRLK